MLVFWIVFEMAGLLFASTAVLGSRLPAPWFAWFNYGLMLIGALLTNYMIFAGEVDVLFTSYSPLRPIRIIIWGSSSLRWEPFSIVHFLITLVVAKKGRLSQGKLSIVHFRDFDCGHSGHFHLTQRCRSLSANLVLGFGLAGFDRSGTVPSRILGIRPFCSTDQLGSNGVDLVSDWNPLRRSRAGQ